MKERKKPKILPQRYTQMTHNAPHPPLSQSPEPRPQTPDPRPQVFPPKNFLWENDNKDKEKEIAGSSPTLYPNHFLPFHKKNSGRAIYEKIVLNGEVEKGTEGSGGRGIELGERRIAYAYI